MLLQIINDANHVFADRHNWLSPLTRDEERKQFVARCCHWWNHTVCPAMDRIGAVWNEGKQRFELVPRRNPPNDGRGPRV
jgi:hypothetical protein